MIGPLVTDIDTNVVVDTLDEKRHDLVLPVYTAELELPKLKRLGVLNFTHIGRLRKVDHLLFLLRD